MILWLIGMMGSGKSTVGSMAAQRIGVDFFDTDDMVESRSGVSIAEIWEQSGEAAFRELESEALREVVDAGTGLAATGGGAVLSDQNRASMTSSGRVAWLRANPDVALQRIPELASRPLLSGQAGSPSFAEILDSRRVNYESVADDIIDTDDKTLEEVVAAVVTLWQP